MFEARFGTAVPFSFREIDKSIGLDMEIHARLNGTAEVEDYDKNLYDSEDKVREAIKTNLNEIVSRCLNDRWDKELSVRSKWPELLGPLMDIEFAGIGITAGTHVNSLAVMPEDEEKIRAFRQENLKEPTYTSVDMVDMSSFDKALKEKTNKIDWCCPMCKTQNTGGMCSYCGFQRPLPFF